MALVKATGRGKERTPAQMAKSAMKEVALEEMRGAELPLTAEVRVTYNGISHTFIANPTVNVEKGSISLNYGATGVNRKDFGIELEGKPALMGVNGNVLTGLAIPLSAFNGIRERYGLEAIQPEPTEDELSAGEET